MNDSGLERIYQTQVEGKTALYGFGMSSMGSDIQPAFERDPELIKLEQSCISQLIKASKTNDMENNIEPDQVKNTINIREYGLEDAFKELLQLKNQ